MKTNFFLAIVLVAVFPFMSACDEDEPSPATISFDVAEAEVTESNGNVESFHVLYGGEGVNYQLKLNLNRPLPATAVVNLSFTGTATRTNDYIIDNTTIAIEKGAQEVIVPITIFEDFAFEYEEDGDDVLLYEDIVVTLVEVVSGPLKIDEENDVFTLRITEDDFVVLLYWDPQDVTGTGPGDVDMDLFVWLEDQFLDASAFEGTQPEGLAIQAGYYEGTYGFSYTYRSGTSNDLDFFSYMFGFVNNDFYAYPVEALESQGTYTQQNLNDYTSLNDIAIVQTALKDNQSFKNVSAINEPATGSRTSATATKATPEMKNRIITMLKNGRIKTLEPRKVR
jgi:hypothetical protein